MLTKLNGEHVAPQATVEYHGIEILGLYCEMGESSEFKRHDVLGSQWGVNARPYPEGMDGRCQATPQGA